MKKIIILALILISGKMLIAQNFYLANTDDSTYYYQNVENTGNDAVQYSTYTRDMKVMVWDGDQPSFYWRLDSSENIVLEGSGILPIDTNAAANSNVHDPDVVLSEGGAVALIVFEKGDSIYICSKEYITNQFNHKYGPFCLGIGSNPNVDVGHNLNHITCVITWEYDSDIFTKTCNIDATNTTTTLIVKKSTGDPRYHRPDVAVSYQERATDTLAVVSYVYALEKPNGNWGFSVVQFYIDTLLDPNKSTNDVLNYPDRTPNVGAFTTGQVVGTPRIAAPAFLQDTFDFSAVTDFKYKNQQNDSVFEILNVTCYNGTINPTYHPINFANSPPPTFPTTPYYNRKPVITYGGDNIHVAWEYYDEPNEIQVDYWHIIKIPLDLSGIPADEYSVVNYNIYTNHLIPSISGRFSYYNEIFYTFYDLDNELISCKSSGAANQNLRKGQFNTEIVVYPNPADDKLYFISKSEIEITAAYLYDIQGKQLIIKTQFNENPEIEIESLPTGVYFVRLIGDGISETHKIYKN